MPVAYTLDDIQSHLYEYCCPRSKANVSATAAPFSETQELNRKSNAVLVEYHLGSIILRISETGKRAVGQKAHSGELRRIKVKKPQDILNYPLSGG